MTEKNDLKDSNEARSETLGLMAKLGGLYGLFFFLQAYGYASGGRTVLGNVVVLPTAIDAAVAHGARHLSHILVPFAKVAWPLSPTLCGILVLYAVSLPHQLRRARDDMSTRAINRKYFSLLIAISLISFGATVLLNWKSALEIYLYWRSLWLWQYVEWILYLALMALGALLAHRLLGSGFGRLLSRSSDNEPWPEITAVLCVAWLFLLAFIGSEFDGYLDARAGVFLH